MIPELEVKAGRRGWPEVCQVWCSPSDMRQCGYVPVVYKAGDGWYSEVRFVIR